MRFEIFYLIKLSHLLKQLIVKVPMICDSLWKIKEEKRRTKCYKISPLFIRKDKKPILTMKSMFYTENRFVALSDAKRRNFIKPIAFFFLKSSIEKHILVAF